jgi:hypothetical protein
MRALLSKLFRRLGVIRVEPRVGVIRVEPRVLSLRPGDTLVFRCPNVLRPGQRDELRARLAERFREIPIVVLDGGSDLSVIRREQAGEPILPERAKSEQGRDT